MTQLDIVESEGAIRLRVRAKPRSARSKVLGVKAGSLEVAIAAPPVDGAANAELCKTVAKFFNVAKGAVSVVGGATARWKLIEVQGLTRGAAVLALELLG